MKTLQDLVAERQVKIDELSDRISAGSPDADKEVLQGEINRLSRELEARGHDDTPDEVRAADRELEDDSGTKPIPS